MKIIQRNNIDIQKWNSLVFKNEGSSIYSSSHFLDCVAKNWCVLVDENYTKGIALPYVQIVNVKKLYTPLFVRYLSFFGEIDEQELREILQKEFDLADFSLKQIEFSEKHISEYYYQELSEVNLNSQAKRSLSKFAKSKIKIKSLKSPISVFEIIKDELKEKVSIFNSERDTSLFHQLLENEFLQKHFLTFGFYENLELVGGMIFLELEDRIIYIKGGAKSEAKKNGVMYRCILNTIEKAFTSHKIFDFGGSRVENVARFNKSFGANDVYYSHLNWDYAPFWFKLLIKLKNRVKSK